MLAAQIEPLDDVLIGLSVRGRDLYEPLAPALQETTGIDIGFWRAGIASVAFDNQTADRLKEDVARQRQAGLRCRSEEHTSELQSRLHLVCRLLLEKKKQNC